MNVEQLLDLTFRRCTISGLIWKAQHRCEIVKGPEDCIYGRNSYNVIDVNKKDSHGYTALHYWAQNCSELVVKILLSAGADPNIRDKNGFTAIECLLLTKNPAESKEIVPLLLHTKFLVDEVSLGRLFICVMKYLSTA